MAVHFLHQSQLIHTSLDEAWAFLSSPHNLPRITPPELGFEILTPDLPERVQPGLMIAYRVRPLFGIPMTWLSEITLVEEGHRFIDAQRLGPYAVWHHEHLIRQASPGIVEMQDRITYALPFPPLGDLAHPILVKPQLQRIFAHRQKALTEIFPPQT